MNQGLHLAPSSLLDRLHDTHLEPTNVAEHLAPRDGVPGNRRVGGRTSERCRRRHLLVPWVGWSSSLVTKDPREVSPLTGNSRSGGGRLSVRLPSGVGFFPHPLPAALSVDLANFLPPGGGQATGLPRSIAIPAWVRSCLSASGSPSASGKFGVPEPGRVPFGPSLSASWAGHQLTAFNST